MAGINHSTVVTGSNDGTKQVSLTAWNADHTITGNVNWAGFGIYSVSIQDASDRTKQLTWSLSGATTGKTLTVSSSHTNNRTITLPDVTDTIAVLGTAQTFTQVQAIQIPSGSNSVPSNAMFQAIGDGTRTVLYMDNYGTGSVTWAVRKANGTLASPTQTLSNDNILNLNAIGYEQVTPGFTPTVVQIRVTATENYTNTANGSKLRFFTTPTGTTTVAEQFDIHNNGDIAIKAGAKMFFDGVAATGNLYIYDNAGEMSFMAGGNLMIAYNSTQLGFFGSTGATRTSSVSLTNSVTSGGTSDIIANYTDLVTYANDASTIRNDIYQLARKIKEIGDALRSYGLLA